MKIHTVYTCEKCGQEFRDSELCRAHESTHIGIKIFAEHKGEYDSDDVYPVYVQLEMSDGSIREYQDTGNFIKKPTEKENPLVNGKED
jgi:DNA-directed RNA polymerase subunit RPC12/RpoP